MNKLLITNLFSILLFFITLFLLGIILDSRKSLNFKIASGTSIQPIIKSSPKIEEIKSNKSNLYLLVIRLKNNSVENIDRFKLELIGSRDSIIRSVEISGRNIGDDEWVRFQFDPIGDSLNKSYKVILSSDTTDKDKAVNAYIDESGLLAIEGYSKVPFIISLETVLASFINKFFMDIKFGIFYISLIAFLITYLIKSIFFNHKKN